MVRYKVVFKDREIDKYKIPYGSHIVVEEGKTVICCCKQQEKVNSRDQS